HALVAPRINSPDNTPSVASYHTDAGHYSATSNYFATAGVDTAPLHAPSNVTTLNGVYQYGSSSFPPLTFNAPNYWLAVVLTTVLGEGDSTPPAVTGVVPAPGATGVGVDTIVSVTFSEAVLASTINASTIELRDAANAAV